MANHCPRSVIHDKFGNRLLSTSQVNPSQAKPSQFAKLYLLIKHMPVVRHSGIIIIPVSVPLLCLTYQSRLEFAFSKRPTQLLRDA